MSEFFLVIFVVMLNFRAESISIEETNRIRAELGLAPLIDDSAPSVSFFYTLYTNIILFRNQKRLKMDQL